MVKGTCICHVCVSVFVEPQLRSEIIVFLGALGTTTEWNATSLT